MAGLKGAEVGGTWAGRLGWVAGSDGWADGLGVLGGSRRWKNSCA